MSTSTKAIQKTLIKDSSVQKFLHTEVNTLSESHQFPDDKNLNIQDEMDIADREYCSQVSSNQSEDGGIKAALPPTAAKIDQK